MERQQQLTVPPPDEIRQRIESRREEIRHLQQLLRLSHAADNARRAQQMRHAKKAVADAH